MSSNNPKFLVKNNTVYINKKDIPSSSSTKDYLLTIELFTEMLNLAPNIKIVKQNN